MRTRSFSTTYLRTFLTSLQDAGADWRVLCREIGLDPGIFADPHARVPGADLLRLWAQAQHVLGEEDLGLRLGERAQLQAANAVVYLLASSDTLREGLARVARYQRVDVEGGRFSIVSEGPNELLEMPFGEPDSPEACNHFEFTTVVALKYCRWITDLEFCPIEVRFRHAAPARPSRHESVFGCPARFHARENGLLVAREVLDRPSAFADPELAAAHERIVKRMHAELDGQAVSAQLRRLLIPRLEQGAPNVKAAARKLGMSARTLQRRLATENTSYADVVDELRREIAEEQLREGRATLAEIAYVTGYAEVSTFQRAFKRWTHRTPSEYRQAL